MGVAPTNFFGVTESICFCWIYFSVLGVLFPSPSALGVTPPFLGVYGLSLGDGLDIYESSSIPPRPPICLTLVACFYCTICINMYSKDLTCLSSSCAALFSSSILSKSLIINLIYLRIFPGTVYGTNFLLVRTKNFSKLMASSWLNR